MFSRIDAMPRTLFPRFLEAKFSDSLYKTRAAEATGPRQGSSKESSVARNLVLTEFQNGLVQNSVAAGRYQNASEALRTGLWLLKWG